jgi:hypothetical protein
MYYRFVLYPRKVRYCPNHRSQNNTLISITITTRQLSSPCSDADIGNCGSLLVCLVNAQESVELIWPLVFRLIVSINYIGI